MTTGADRTTAGTRRLPAETLLWPELITLFYESAGSLSKQQAFVNTLSRFFDADAAAFVVWAGDPSPLMRAVLSGLEFSDLATEYEDRAAADSLFGRLESTDDYTVVGGQFGHRRAPGLSDRHWIAGLMENDGVSRIALLVARPATSAPLGPEAVSAMRELLPYLRRCMQQNQLFERYRHTAQAGTFLVDRAMRGILMFSPTGNVLYRNDEAQRILDADDGISQSEDRLSFTDPEAQSRFREFLVEATDKDAQSSLADLKQGLSLRVNRPSGQAPYQFVLYRLPTGLSEATLDQALALFAALIHDPEQAVPLSGKSIRQFFRLTPAETNLAVALLREHRLTDAAESLGISINTARTQLKGIFHKLGVNSQPAMMQRLTQTLELRQAPPPGDPD